MYRSSPLDRDERAGAAALGLVRAAARWGPGDAAFETYALRACLRAIHRAGRGLRRRPTVGLESPDRLPGREPSPAAEASAREERGRLRRAFDGLTPRQREALTLYLSGLRWCEVARAMGLRRSNVEQLRARAVARLRAELDGPHVAG